MHAGKVRVEGSSPLARGLPCGWCSCRGSFRIIPARAGFTRARPHPDHDRRDHPRSRGVYCTRVKLRFPFPGSSPLARGLHRQRLRRIRRLWIIPARAGFTGVEDVLPGAVWDHPRSRGVYSRGHHRHRAAQGSSPLARGLLGASAAVPIAAGIIPARAGFTPSCLASLARLRDHPRSRGVYPGRLGRDRRRRGSSPLARGLRRRVATARRCAGIIPARAGFTRSSTPTRARARDHPRSRGVYAVQPDSVAFLEGSSPLARGLRYAKALSASSIRIIPARAGFTSVIFWPGVQSADHPRSRGVYWRPSRTTPSSAGSSPLARGLLRDGAVRAGGRGIIPARAGFTRPTESTARCATDHPRSRGVYRRARTGSPTRGGSSPLARGLLMRPCISCGPMRIIPARAGFTFGCSPGRSRTRDHPRSRGVYELRRRRHVHR